MHKDFVVVPIYKATGNAATASKRFCTSVIAKELGLYNIPSADTFCKIATYLQMMLLAEI